MSKVYKFGSLLGVVALVLLFINWVIDTSFIRKAASLHTTLDNIWNERWVYDELTTIIDEQKNHSLYLSQLNADKGIPPGWEQTNEAKEFYYFTSELGASANFPLRLTDLLKFAWRTQELSVRIPGTEPYRNRIDKLVKSLNQLNKEVLKTKEVFDSTTTALFGSSISASEITEEKLSIIRNSIRPYQNAVKTFENGYLKYKNEFLLINTKLYQQAKDEANLSSATSSIYSGIAFWIYIFASILAILGKWFDIKQKELDKKV